MKVKLEKAVSMARIAARLNGIRMNNSATARKIFSMKRLTMPWFEFYSEEERKLVEELNGVIEEDGAILFPKQEEGIRKLAEGRRELLDTEIDIDIDKPFIFRDAENVPISGEEIETLEGLAEFKE